MIARYTRPALTELWSDRHRYDTWLRVELAACVEMEAAGSVPAGTAAAVQAKAAGKLDPARILEHEERTKHDVIAFLSHVEELAGEPADLAIGLSDVTIVAADSHTMAPPLYVSGIPADEASVLNCLTG